MNWFFAYADFAAFGALIFASQLIGRLYPKSLRAYLPTAELPKLG